MNQFLHTAQHTTEGCAYLIYIGIFLRWKFPKSWNNMLKQLAAKDLSAD